MAKVIQATIKNTRQLLEANKETSVVIANGEILALTAGFAVPADSSTTAANLLGVSNEDISVADAKSKVLYLVASDEDTFIFPTANATNAAHNGQVMVLSDSKKVNNTGTTAEGGIVQQVEPYGVAADKLIIGKFITL